MSRFIVLTLVVLASHAGALYIASQISGERLIMFVVSVFTGAPMAVMLSLILHDTLTTKTVNLVFADEKDAEQLPDMSRVFAAIQSGDREAALREYQILEKAFPHLPDMLTGQEAMYSMLGRYRDAAETCRKLIQRFRKDDVVWMKAATRLAQILDENLGDTFGAEDVRRAISLRNPDHRYNLLRTEKSLEHPTPKPDERGRHGLHGVHVLETARRLARQGKTREAVEMYRRYFERNGNEPRALFEIVSVHEQSGQHEAAVRTCHEIVNKFALNDEVWAEATLRIATIQQNYLGNTDVAVEVLRKVAKRMRGTEAGRLAEERLQNI